MGQLYHRPGNQCLRWIEYLIMPGTYADKLIRLYQSLHPPEDLPDEISVLFPQKDPGVMKLVRTFLKKFYADLHPRRFIFGINPGRFGAGLTGINFTAPKQLEEHCGIRSPFKLSSELSAEFIYEMILEYGGVNKFYKDWFISAVCPLGFIKDGKNINYYDDKKLISSVSPFIIESFRKQVGIGFKTDYCICIGGEKNYRFLAKLNDEFGWFQQIAPLPHPRFILQYRRKQKEKYIREYLSALHMAG